MRCSLELAGAVAPLDCVVVEFDETDVHLAVAALDAEGRAALAEVAAAAYLVFPGPRGSLHALRAVVVESDRPGALALRLLDRFRLGQRRRAARAPLALRARVEAGGDVAEAVSADISTGGCRLRFTAPWHAAGPATIRFALGDASEMRLEARLVRVDGLEASFAFTDPGSEERRQLSALVRAYNAAA
ncbi:MAG: PilZ domain-containing protein [Solirubrobacteraceae bacterium]